MSVGDQHNVVLLEIVKQRRWQQELLDAIRVAAPTDEVGPLLVVSAEKIGEAIADPMVQGDQHLLSLEAKRFGVLASSSQPEPPLDGLTTYNTRHLNRQCFGSYLGAAYLGDAHPDCNRATATHVVHEDPWDLTPEERQHPFRIDTPLVFPDDDGDDHLDLGTWRWNEWNPALESAGLPKRVPYSMRHNFAIVAGGISLFYLARLMGSSVEQIDRTSGHLLPDSEEYLRGLLDSHDSGGAGRSASSRAPSS